MSMQLPHLTSGTKIRVIKAFQDFDRRQIKVASILTYQSHDYFIHDGGYTFRFSEGTIRLAEIFENDDYVLTHFDEFFELME